MVSGTDFVPLNDNVLLEMLDKAPEQYICKVIAIGPGLLTIAGRVPCSVSVGDIVLIGRYAANWVFSNKDKFLVCREYKLRLKIENYEG